MTGADSRGVFPAPDRTISERAADVRKQLQADLEQVCRTIDAAVADGFHVSYGTREGPGGKQIIDKIEIMAKL